MNPSPHKFYNIDTSQNPKNIVADIFQPYAIEVNVGNSIFKFGRFAHGLVKNLNIICDQPLKPTILFEAGSFIETHDSCRIIIGGEHCNTSVFYNSMGVFGEVLANFFTPQEKFDLRIGATGISIETGAILSADTTVVDGAYISRGTLIAAGGVVAGSCDPYSVYGGVPARKLKTRLAPDRTSIADALDIARVRTHSLPSFPSLAKQCELGLISIDGARAKIDYMAEIPEIKMTGRIGPGNQLSLTEIVGFRVGLKDISENNHVEKLLEYFNQAKSPTKNFVWSPDVFHAIGVS